MADLETTLAENINLIAKSFQTHAPEVWQYAVKFQETDAFSDIIYYIALVICMLVGWFFAIKQINKLKSATAVWWACMAVFFLFTSVNVNNVREEIVRYNNAEYFAALELVRTIKH